MTYPFDCLTELVFVPEEEPRPADIILVPGGSHTQPMAIAAQLYHEGYAPLVLPSGGNNPKLDRTEWEHLQQIGVSLGVPEHAILREDKAKNTFDNARNSWSIIKEHQLEVNRAILVCKAYFSRRALMTYQAVFPPTVQFCVQQDSTRVNRHDWFKEEAGIKLVLTEARKIATYFEPHIPRWVERQASSR
ncbi:YdcF family protein [Paenibacillus dendritiformis]|uniref:DUF218 domain-containing protein n=1 Tax=Paenibacillus dendritiformis C454 TaxID=1131935 RepID=H3SP19_9BACL|nr:YdcF family protein [Paenibacillus dendritiformis]EHQ59175.1 hypothetical protein PDENDC454_26638 [Paenibacillus dendritiformis C454]CAH8771118.1 YdcF family protein [Paenibacillus dendritiformis]